MKRAVPIGMGQSSGMTDWIEVLRAPVEHDIGAFLPFSSFAGYRDLHFRTIR